MSPWWPGKPQRDSRDTTASDTSSHADENQDPKPPTSPSSSSSTSKSIRSFSSSTPKDWNSILNATDWAQFKEPRNLIPTVLLTAGILFTVHVHRRFLRRIPEARNISKSQFRQRRLLGRVTSVGDGDNFRMYHTPGGRLAGWGWLPWKKVPTSKKDLKGGTVGPLFFSSILFYFLFVVLLFH